ncbi:hypothetical protein [Anaeromyxobacter sp. Fw109-5]|uniref:hypothetical protein n=1 Tax=Anaeromyxobacter sp. (strain Fw109-5) TaxID=404589 RepID=UPI000673E8BA|nr:hypothetical protein [Anaeromyxobacter sp. Fw109-5]
MDLIALYVEDHLALSLGGIRLARRSLGENRGTPFAAPLERLIPDLEEDRDVLKDLLRALGGSRSALKEAAVVLGEYAGRLKPNGRLLSYSPLSRVWELEGLLAGSESRRGMWNALARVQRQDRRLEGFDFAALEARARRHLDELERWRLRAAEEAFGLAPRRRSRAATPQPAR